ncbi:exported protein [Geminocystis sp. NIES-3708]|uniref:DUF192 domain-containing protein n=1 Tax=Geminocystis sp. NIES-3708 TaxID=1615909 RepID=UPI0005FC7EAA|nr:DUF192 domain-containing protein [Geminocystis sp. NIES-3708]BAQ62432.1 exported protein [Geminocystis sp. NIES-3708]
MKLFKNYPLIILISFFFFGCDFESPSVSDNQINNSVEITPVDNTSLAQNLPIGAKLLINDQEIELEIAATPQQQSIGLMYRNSLPPNRGMLFPFNPPQTVSFWMKNVSIPLDMIFVSEGVVKNIVKAPPCKVEPCPLFNSNVPIDQVIELAENRSTELKINIGDRINVKMVEDEKKKEN